MVIVKVLGVIYIMSRVFGSIHIVAKWLANGMTNALFFFPIFLMLFNWVIIHRYILAKFDDIQNMKVENP
jgi:hypothetical protein